MEPEETETPPHKKKTIAERDAALMNAWKEREGSLANAEFEDGKVEEGYRRHVVSSCFIVSFEKDQPDLCRSESKHISLYMNQNSHLSIRQYIV